MSPRSWTKSLPAAAGTALLAILAPGEPTAAQPPPLDRVLAFPPPILGEALQVDRGASGAWHRIRKLATTASVLHVTAHPDDEHSGMLTLAGRGWGARTALLSLNRGEAGANAIGPELFDALGLIRTRELVLSGRYYALDDLYFTTAVDYGYSKSVEEAFRSWDREAVLEDVVRVIRLNRPLVVVSRFHGTRRDGHGHHHAAGLLTPEAVAAAADPERFPEQIAREGLRPWKVLRIYRGGVRVDEPHDVAVDAGAYGPSLGMSYQQWASLGLSLQRSQTSGRVRGGAGRVYRYERLEIGDFAPVPNQNTEFVGHYEPEVADNAGENGFFAGLNTTLRGLPTLLGEEAGEGLAGTLVEIQTIIDGVVDDFDFTAPERSVPELVRGYGMLNGVVDLATPELAFHLRVKQRQFEDAIVAAAGVEVEAVLESEAGGALLVPGEEAEVAVRVRSTISEWVNVASVRVLFGTDDVLSALDVDYELVVSDADARAGDALATGRVTRVAEVLDEPFDIRIPAGDASAGPYFTRSGPAENHYEVEDSADLHLPWRRSRLRAVVGIEVLGEHLTRTVAVTGSVSRLPYGSLARRAEVPARALGDGDADGAGGRAGWRARGGRCEPRGGREPSGWERRPGPGRRGRGDRDARPDGGQSSGSRRRSRTRTSRRLDGDAIDGSA